MPSAHFPQRRAEMAAKRTTKKGPDCSGPKRTQREIARDNVRNGRLAAYPEHVQTACSRLLDHDEMSRHWGDEFNAGDFMQAVYAFDLATGRDAWGRKANGARKLWLKSFNSTVNRLKKLLTEAPLTPEAWGFPVRDGLIMHAMSFVRETPRREDGAPYYQVMWELERKLDQSGVTIAHVLDVYVMQQNIEAEPKQIIPKPADADSDRAFFVKTMGLYTDCSVEVIASATTVVFGLEDYDHRTVGRRIRGR